MTKFSKAVANKQTVATKAKAEAAQTAPDVAANADTMPEATLDTTVTAGTTPVPTQTEPEKSANEIELQKQIDELTKMVRTVSDRNALEKFDDSQKGKGQTRYAIPLYDGKVVRGWNYKNERDVKLRGADADNSVIMEMYDGTKIELTYQMWVKTMYVSEQIPHLSTSNKNGITLITFSFQAEDDESPALYEIDKRYLNAR